MQLLRARDAAMRPGYASLGHREQRAWVRDVTSTKTPTPTRHSAILATVRTPRSPAPPRRSRHIAEACRTTAFTADRRLDLLTPKSPAHSLLINKPELWDVIEVVFEWVHWYNVEHRHSSFGHQMPRNLSRHTMLEEPARHDDAANIQAA